MADPFLVTHQVGPAVFDIGGKLYPVSIRDQMVRGQSIVDRAIAAGFGTMGADLLVIGAGAAGATAAIEAASRGITTHLIDSAPLPFLRQAACSTRWIHPHEYDWPLDHWPTSGYPYVGTPAPYYGPVVPLPWAASWSDVLALGWSIRLNRAFATYSPRLSLHYGSRLSAAGPPTFSPRTWRWTVPLAPPGRPALSVGMIVIAVGFGAERVTAPRIFAAWHSGRPTRTGPRIAACLPLRESSSPAVVTAPSRISCGSSPGSPRPRKSLNSARSRPRSRRKSSPPRTAPSGPTCGARQRTETMTSTGRST